MAGYVRMRGARQQLNVSKVQAPSQILKTYIMVPSGHTLNVWTIPARLWCLYQRDEFILYSLIPMNTLIQRSSGSGGWLRTLAGLMVLVPVQTGSTEVTRMISDNDLYV